MLPTITAYRTGGVKLSFFKIHRELQRQHLFLSAVKLIQGSVLAQLITMVCMPVITRQYSPENFGVLNIYISSVAIITILMSLSMQHAIALTAGKKEIWNILYLVFFVSLGFGLVCYCAFMLLGEEISQLLGLGGTATIFFMPLGAMILALSAVIEASCFKYDLFSKTAKSQIIMSTSNNFLKLGGGIFSGSYSILILSTIAAQGLKLIYLWKTTSKEIELNVCMRPEKSHLLQTLRKFSDFPLYRMPQMLLHALSQNAPIILLTIFFGASITGNFGLAMVMVTVPANIIGNSVSNALYPSLANKFLKQKKLINQDIFNALKTLAVIGFLPVVTFVYFSHDVFVQVFGGEWSSAATYAAYLSISAYFMLISRPVIAAIPVLGLQKWLLNFELISTSLKLILICATAVITADPIAVVIVFSLASVLAYIAIIYFVMIISRKPHERNITER